ncbi:MAG: PmoA family protein [Akkermansiaceae bacterium]|nr:PmoA family protein [Akkermansiaceae bacterium]
MIRLLTSFVLSTVPSLLATENLRLGRDEKAGTISVYRANLANPILTQSARPGQRPFLHPIVAPDGKGVLTEFSPGHHKHQTGLYWGFTRVNGRDFFHNLKSDYWKRNSVQILAQSGQTVSWQTSYDLLDDKGQAVLTQTQTWTMSSSNQEHTLDLNWQGTAKTDVTIGKWNYGGLFLRMPWHKEKTKGEVINSALQKNNQAEGKRAVWVDVGMDIEDRDDWGHIAIFDHPKNSDFPLPWRVDGQLGIGPSRAILGDWKIPKGQTETIRHRFLIHTGKLNPEALTKKWENYSKLPYRDVTFISTPAKPVPLIDLNQARLENIIEMDRDHAFFLLFDQLAKTENPITRRSLLKGILLGLDGQRNLPPPPGWLRLRANFLDQKDPELTKLVERLSQVFGDKEAVARALATLKNKAASLPDRKQALASLLTQRHPGLAPILKSIIDEPALRINAIRAFTSAPTPDAAKLLLGLYPKFEPDAQRAIIETLATRKAYAEALHTALKEKKISREALPAYVARSLSLLLGPDFTKEFGLKKLPADKEAEIAKYKALATPAALDRADVSFGRKIYQSLCFACHVMYGEGGKIGPELTGSNRADLNYLLLNILYPSDDIADSYKTVTINTKDGRSLSGNITEEDGQKVVLNMIGQKSTIPKGDIKSRTVSDFSMMPAGLLQTLKNEDVVALFKYMQTKQQVPLSK